ncbi:MAG: hypothetical protein IPL61_13970, partial [Myxococcales bacterium]|nr:hypothetical protein [Myxococcales bacterium]
MTGLVATAESGRVPDVAEPLRLNGVAGDDDVTVQTIEPLVGQRPVLVILGSAVLHAIPAERARAAVFGYGDGEVVPPGYADFVTSNARRYFREVSHDRFEITPAATLGWFPLTKAALVLQAAGVPDTETYYWQYDVSCGHANVGLHQGFKSGHSERMHDMVQAAVDAGFDFASYDRDGSGVLEPNELGILLIHPPAGSGNGSEAGVRTLFAQQCAGGADAPQAMQAGGVELPTTIVEYFADFDDATEPFQFSTVDHELLHLFAGLGDLYQDDAQGDPFTHVASVDELSLMGRNRKTTSILDAVHRIALGWATPRTLAAAGQYALLDAQAGDVVGVLPRFNHEAFDEYLVIENRRKHDDLTGYWFDQFAAVSDAQRR